MEVYQQCLQTSLGSQVTAPTNREVGGATPASQLLAIDDVTIEFHARKQLFSTVAVRALDGVSLHVDRAETVAVVGESGSGKTTLARVCLCLLEPTNGTVTFDGQDITRVRDSGLKRFRHRAQGIFQDPFSQR